MKGFFLGYFLLFFISLDSLKWEVDAGANSLQGKVNQTRKKRSIVIQNDDLHNFICWKYGHGSLSMEYRQISPVYEKCAETGVISRDVSKCSRYAVCAPSNDDDYLHMYYCQCENLDLFSLEKGKCTSENTDCSLPMTTTTEIPYHVKINDLVEAPSFTNHRVNGKFSPDLSSECQFTGKFPLENYCDRYIQCLPGPSGTFEAYLHLCPPGKDYSKNYRLCMHPHLARCPYKLKGKPQIYTTSSTIATPKATYGTVYSTTVSPKASYSNAPSTTVSPKVGYSTAPATTETQKASYSTTSSTTPSPEPSYSTTASKTATPKELYSTRPSTTANPKASYGTVSSTTAGPEASYGTVSSTTNRTTIPYELPSEMSTPKTTPVATYEESTKINATEVTSSHPYKEKRNRTDPFQYTDQVMPIYAEYDPEPATGNLTLGSPTYNDTQRNQTAPFKHTVRVIPTYEEPVPEPVKVNYTRGSPVYSNPQRNRTVPFEYTDQVMPTYQEYDQEPSKQNFAQESPIYNDPLQNQTDPFKYTDQKMPTYQEYDPEPSNETFTKESPTYNDPQQNGTVPFEYTDQIMPTYQEYDSGSSKDNFNQESPTYYDPEMTGQGQPLFPRNSSTYPNELPQYNDPGEEIAEELLKYYGRSYSSQTKNVTGNKTAVHSDGKLGQKYLFKHLSLKYSDTEPTFHPDEDGYYNNETTADDPSRSLYENNQPSLYSELVPEYKPDVPRQTDLIYSHNSTTVSPKASYKPVPSTTTSSTALYNIIQSTTASPKVSYSTSSSTTTSPTSLYSLISSTIPSPTASYSTVPSKTLSPKTYYGSFSSTPRTTPGTTVPNVTNETMQLDTTEAPATPPPSSTVTPTEAPSSHAYKHKLNRTYPFEYTDQVMPTYKEYDPELSKDNFAKLIPTNDDPQGNSGAPFEYTDQVMPNYQEYDPEQSNETFTKAIPTYNDPQQNGTVPFEYKDEVMPAYQEYDPEQSNETFTKASPTYNDTQQNGTVPFEYKGRVMPNYQEHSPQPSNETFTAGSPTYNGPQRNRTAPFEYTDQVMPSYQEYDLEPLKQNFAQENPTYSDPEKTGKGFPGNSTYIDEMPHYYDPGEEITEELFKYYAGNQFPETESVTGNKTHSDEKLGQKYFFKHLSLNYSDNEPTYHPDEDLNYNNETRTDDPLKPLYKNHQPPLYSTSSPEYKLEVPQQTDIIYSHSSTTNVPTTTGSTAALYNILPSTTASPKASFSTVPSSTLSPKTSYGIFSSTPSTTPEKSVPNFTNEKMKSYTTEIEATIPTTNGSAPLPFSTETPSEVTISHPYKHKLNRTYPFEYTDQVMPTYKEYDPKLSKDNFAKLIPTNDDPQGNSGAPFEYTDQVMPNYQETDPQQSNETFTKESPTYNDPQQNGTVPFEYTDQIMPTYQEYDSGSSKDNFTQEKPTYSDPKMTGQGQFFPGNSTYIDEMPHYYDPGEEIAEELLKYYTRNHSSQTENVAGNKTATQSEGKLGQKFSFKHLSFNYSDIKPKYYPDEELYYNNETITDYNNHPSPLYDNQDSPLYSEYAPEYNVDDPPQQDLIYSNTYEKIDEPYYTETAQLDHDLEDSLSSYPHSPLEVKRVPKSVHTDGDFIP